MFFLQLLPHFWKKNPDQISSNVLLVVFHVIISALSGIKILTKYIMNVLKIHLSFSYSAIIVIIFWNFAMFQLRSDLKQVK